MRKNTERKLIVNIFQKSESTHKKDTRHATIRVADVEMQEELVRNNICTVENLCAVSYRERYTSWPLFHSTGYALVK